MRLDLLLIGIGIFVASNSCYSEPSDGNSRENVKVQQHYENHDDKKLVDDCVAEVIRIHQFFEGWFKGTIERTSENYARATSAIMDEYSQITPDGNYWERKVLFPKLEQSYGMYSSSEPPFRLWIKNARAVPLEGGNYCLSIYEEWRQLEGIERGYVTTAILKRSLDAPNGVKWLHLQETWLPRDEEIKPTQ